MNDAGTITGDSYNATATHAFRKTAGGAVEDLGDLADGSTLGLGEDINASGQVSGWSRNADNSPHVFLWDPTNGMQDLGDLAGGADYSVNSGLNDAGRIIGASGSTAEYLPFVWDALWGMHDLNNLIPAGLGDMLAGVGAINASGQIVGYGTEGGTGFT
jgi:probable HAF family extracellular repeat protein